jgi:hypothetical protein
MFIFSRVLAPCADRAAGRGSHVPSLRARFQGFILSRPGRNHGLVTGRRTPPPPHVPPRPPGVVSRPSQPTAKRGPASRPPRRARPEQSKHGKAAQATPPAPEPPRPGHAVSGSSYPQVPLDDEALAFGVAGDPLAVAAELGVVGRQQLQSGEGALAELVHEAAVSEDAVHLPVGCDRPPVHDFSSRAPGAGSCSSSFG